MANVMENTHKPAKERLMTKWAEEIDIHNVLPEYPRPQMVRASWLNLNGLWDYAISKSEAAELPKGKSTYDGKILVPFPIESALSGVERALLPDELLWYRRTFSIPQEWEEQRVLLHFGAVDWKATVWVNGNFVGEHTGGYYPFSFDITEHIRCDTDDSQSTNEIVVSVWDGTDVHGLERGKQTLNPQGIFYTAVSGIWQTVWLEPVPRTFIKSHRVTPDLDNERVLVSVECIEDQGSADDRTLRDLQIEVTVLEGETPITSCRGSIHDVVDLKMPNSKLWTPDSPFLYDLRIELRDQEALLDSITSYFGMRKYSIARDEKGIKRLFVNNKPLFQHGVLDQGYWPDGLYTAPTDEALQYDLVLTKKFGFNMTRKHIKVEPARWYYHCDRLGLIVWQDMISGGKNVNIVLNGIIPMVASGLTIRDNKYARVGRQDEGSRRNFEKELKEMIDALYHFPSIAMWVPFNEAWGQFDAERIAKWTKEYDPTRWVDHASGWHDQGADDLRSVHIYFRKLKKPKKIKDRPWVISEFGGYSLPVAGHVWDKSKEFGYKKFKEKGAFQGAYAKLLQEEVQPLIGEGLSATVYTQLTDVETETNGLVTYDRKVVKIDPVFHVVVEQTRDYNKRMKYDPATNSFVETQYESLLSVRGFPYPYGWLKESGTPPGRHLDVILMSSKPYALGDKEQVKIVGCFMRSDGDHKLVCVEMDRAVMDFAELSPEEKEALNRLYPQIGEGEGWFGAEVAEAIVDDFLHFRGVR